MSGYILNRDGIEQENRTKLYRQTELELMTTHQLREVCRREKIIPGVLNPLDKEELIHVIMRYRGSRQQRLIIEACDDKGNVIGEGKMYYGGVGVGVEAHMGVTYTFSLKQILAKLDTNKD